MGSGLLDNRQYGFTHSITRWHSGVALVKIEEGRSRGWQLYPFVALRFAGSRTLGRATWVLPSVGRSWWPSSFTAHSPAVIVGPTHRKMEPHASYAPHNSARVSPHPALFAKSSVAQDFGALVVLFCSLTRGQGSWLTAPRISLPLPGIVQSLETYTASLPRNIGCWQYAAAMQACSTAELSSCRLRATDTTIYQI